jgi:hypothetical protein
VPCEHAGERNHCVLLKRHHSPYIAVNSIPPPPLQTHPLLHRLRLLPLSRPDCSSPDCRSSGCPGRLPLFGRFLPPVKNLPLALPLFFYYWIRILNLIGDPVCISPLSPEFVIPRCSLARARLPFQRA